MASYNGIKYQNSNLEICLGPDKNVNLTEVDISPKTKIITRTAFANCGIERLDIHNETEIFDFAFFHNFLLEDAFINCKIISPSAFTSCGSKTDIGMEMTLVNTISIAEAAFAFCCFNKLNLPDTLKSIGERAFEGTLFQNTILVLPRNLEHIGLDAFYDTNLTDIYLPDSIKSLEPFADSDLTVHVSKKLFDKLNLDNSFGHIVVDTEETIGNNMDMLLEKMSFKDLNNRLIQKEINNETIHR